MITDLEAAQLCQKSYFVGTSYSFGEPLIVEGVTSCVEQRPGGTVVAFRGSDSLEDWFRDLRAVPEHHPVLGFVHAGFMEGVENYLSALLPMLQGDVQLMGHSLGAAHAVLVSGLLAAMGRPPKRLALFGCPRPGFSKLSGIVSGEVKNISSYRNRDDPVTQVPWLLGMYKTPVPVTEIQSPVDGGAAFKNHFIYRYIEALK